MNKIKITGNGWKFLVAVLIVVGLYVAYKIPKTVKQHKQLELAIPDAPTASSTSEVQRFPNPSSEVVSKGYPITWVKMPWNAQLGSDYASGGVTSTKGSLMEKYGIKLTSKSNPDCYQSGDDFVTYWEQNKDNLDNCPGYLVSYMFDGTPYLAARMQAKLDKIGLHCEVITFAGKSDGEDKAMFPIQAKSNPSYMLGKNVALVTMDGDENNVEIWCKDNNLKFNPDPETWSPDMVNVISVADYIKAADFYNSGATIEKFVIKNGKRTSEKIKVSADGGCATWTPGDAKVAFGKGGLYVANSTKGSTQMPCAVISIKEWDEKHTNTVIDFVTAVAAGGDQVRNFKDAQEYAAKVSHAVYQIETPEYWLKYYRGIDTVDKQGIRVSLGGSQAFNLNDALSYFNPTEGNKPIAQIVYETFGNQTLEYYGSSDFKSYIPYSSFVNSAYVNSAASKYSDLLSGKAIETKYDTGEITDVQGKADYQINFETGSAKIKSSSYSLLNDIANRLMIQKQQKGELYGYTDNTGNADNNLTLSDLRAKSVREYLISRGVKENRLTALGKGVIMEGNETEAGKAANRKVQIIVGE